jgi:hypothetical protein
MTLNLQNLQLPTLAQLEAAVPNLGPVLGPFASMPQVAFVLEVVLPLLEGALTIGQQLPVLLQQTQTAAQAGQPAASDPIKAFISAELQKLAGVMAPTS